MTAQTSTIFDKKEQPHSYAAERYARAVVSGRRVECIDVVQACKRFLSDLEKENAPFYYDVFEAEKSCKWIEKLPHTRGKWGRKPNNKNFIDLEDWQKFFIVNVCAWKWEATETRRFNEAFLFVARKNAKSTLAAGLTLYLHCEGGEYAPESFSGATTEKQAHEVFNTLKQMCRKRPSLVKKYSLEVRTKTILSTDSGGKIEPVVGKPGDGASPAVWVVDEYHEHKTADQYDTASTGMGSREAPLMLVITTAGTDISYPCYDYQKGLSNMLRGIGEMDDCVFALMYAMDPEDDYRDIKCVKKANPNCEVSVSESYLRSQLTKAMNSPRKLNTFLTKHCNQWVNSASAWIDVTKWTDLADPSLKIEDFKEDLGAVGIDLSKRLDFTAKVYVFRRIIDGLNHYYVFPKLYLPSKTIENADMPAYNKWLHTGEILETDGAELNHSEIIEELDEVLATHTGIKAIPIDPAKADDYFRHYENDPRLFEHPQRNHLMSPAMREFEAALESGRIHHDGNECLAWMLSNVQAKESPGGLIAPRKPNNDAKIDGAISLLMGLYHTKFEPEGEAQSSLEKHGVRML